MNTLALSVMPARGYSDRTFDHAFTPFVSGASNGNNHSIITACSLYVLAHGLRKPRLNQLRVNRTPSESDGFNALAALAVLCNEQRSDFAWFIGAHVGDERPASSRCRAPREQADQRKPKGRFAAPPTGRSPFVNAVPANNN